MKKLFTTLCLVLLSSCSQPDGPYETFHENGQLALRGNNVDGETDGLSEYFEENGNLTGTETYRNGELVETNENP